tara:strand:+ start:490 stop:879 length:390 start_codon:yes stop_codon:yes gene_type:complete
MVLAATPIIRSSSEFWDRMTPIVARALEKNATHSFEDVAHGIRRGWYQFFAEGDSFMLGESIQHPLSNSYQIWLAAGDLQKLMEMEPHVVAWGKETGHTRAEVAGRKGWEPALKDLGYKHHTTVLVKTI